MSHWLLEKVRDMNMNEAALTKEITPLSLNVNKVIGYILKLQEV